jgi:uncharacterized zinc-type alcohol dehydrogenase-like protein
MSEPTEVSAFGNTAADAPLEQRSILRRKPTPHDLEIDILFCGVCHSGLTPHEVNGGADDVPSCARP